MNIVLNESVVENHIKIEQAIQKFKGVSGNDYVLAFNQLQTHCGIYWAEKSVSGYINNLNKQSQHCVYLGRADKRGRIQRI